METLGTGRNMLTSERENGVLSSHDQGLFPTYFQTSADIWERSLRRLEEYFKYSRMHVIYVESIFTAKKLCSLFFKQPF